MQPKLIIEQKITVMANQYSIYKVLADGSKGELLAFAHQKRLALKEKIEFYTDESKTELVFSFRAEKVLDVHGRFLVEDAKNTPIGIFRKDFTKSLAASTWYIVDDNDARLISFTEANKTLAILRRYLEFVPIVGDILAIPLIFFRFHFTATNAQDQTVGQYRKTTLLRDHYTLAFDEESYQNQDWRLLASVCVALDALQSR